MLRLGHARCARSADTAQLCSRDPAEVVKGLYIGSLDVARCPARLACLGVQAVVDASQTAYHLPPGIERLIVDEEDQPCADLHRHFGAVSQFVASHVRAGAQPLPLSQRPAP